MAQLWAKNKDTVKSANDQSFLRSVVGKGTQAVAQPLKRGISLKATTTSVNIDYGYISNDENSREYIQGVLIRKEIDHKAILDNLVFDYLNTSVVLRDQLIELNVIQVKEQIQVRIEQIQAQQKAGYAVGSFNVVETTSNVASSVRREFSTVGNESTFGQKMAKLWATNRRSVKGFSNSTTIGKGFHAAAPSNTEIYLKDGSKVYSVHYSNDEKSRQHIQSVLIKEEITHKATVNNLEFDYLNTPVEFRDKLIKQNIDQVKEQIQMRTGQIQAQQKAGYAVGSFNVVETTSNVASSVRREFSTVGNESTFGQKMAKLWATNQRSVKGFSNSTTIGKGFHAAAPSNTEIYLKDGSKVYSVHYNNDEKSREYIQRVLIRKEIDHKATLDNLVFDYLNTSVVLRDQLIELNVIQVKEQIQVRIEQIQAQQKAGYAVGLFNVVETTSNVASSVRREFSTVGNESTFGQKMAKLWATNRRSVKGFSNSTTIGKGFHAAAPSNTEIYLKDGSKVYSVHYSNDEKSRQHIQSVLIKEEITHKATVNNLEFDYLNTPVEFRDKLIKQNIDQVKEQIQMRTGQIQAQHKAGYSSGSFDVVESGNGDGYLESLEKRVSVLEERMKIPRSLRVAMSADGRLERLEDRISALEKSTH